MANAYLIETDSGLVLVDAGMPGDERKVLARMKAIGREDLRLIYITHGHVDHYGCAAALRTLTGAPVAVHQADAEDMANGRTRLGTARGRGRILGTTWPVVGRLLQAPATPADIVLDDGDDLSGFGLEATVLHTPGHTLGSTSLVVEGRYAFTGDLLTNSGRPRMQRFYAQDWSLFPASLARLQAAGPEWVYTGHGTEPVGRDELAALKVNA